VAPAAKQQQDNEYHDDEQSDQPEDLYPARRRHGVAFPVRGGIGHAGEKVYKTSCL
jgi:hypothetical protein